MTQKYHYEHQLLCWAKYFIFLRTVLVMQDSFAHIIQVASDLWMCGFSILLSICVLFFVLCSLTVRLCYHVLVLSVYLPLKVVFFPFYQSLCWLWTNMSGIMLIENVDLIKINSTNQVLAWMPSWWMKCISFQWKYNLGFLGFFVCFVLHLQLFLEKWIHEVMAFHLN